MKIEDLVVEVMGTDSKFIRAAAQLVCRAAGTDSIGANAAGTVRKFGRDYKKLAKKHGENLA